MSYPLEPERPTSPPIPPTPLPRLQPPNVEKPAEETPRKDSKREKSKTLKRNATGDGDRGSKQDSAATRSGRVKMEETPALDTYDSRRKARILIGSLVLGSLLLIGFLIAQRFSPSEPDPNVDDPLAQAIAAKGSGPATDKARLELEARNMYDQARQIALNGNPPLAVTMLERVTTAYPESKAAQDAQKALERSNLNLPLFPTSEAVAVNASEAPKTPKTDEPEPVVVEATSPVGPGPATADVQLELPANPAEPGRAIAPGVPQDVPDQPTRALPGGFRAGRGRGPCLGLAPGNRRRPRRCADGPGPRGRIYHGTG